MWDKPLISFDYAIKYLLKDKGDYDIVEGFISALLKAQGYESVKIKALLDTESNKETSHLKKSIADLVVEDSHGHKYIVEIERAYTENIIHKACFNSSRLIVDSISIGLDYTLIKKVFHVSLLYFIPNYMKGPLTHGKTVFKTGDTQEPIDLHVVNLDGKIFDLNILPEYFLISVPLFDDVVRQELDEWFYLMKHSKTREDFKSPAMKKVADRLSVLKMKDEERTAYYRYMKEAVSQSDVLKSAENKGRTEGIAKGIAKGMAKGIAKGMAKGRKEGMAKGMVKGIARGMAKGRAKGKTEGKREAQKKMAKLMLSENESIDKISKFTGLTRQEIKDLKN